MKRVFIISSIVVGIVLIVALVAISTRVRKDIKKKLAFENTYAIQNVASGMCVRPFDAGYQNGNKIIAYSHKDWECITWEIGCIGRKHLFAQKPFYRKNLSTEIRTETRC